jgi:excisionase family DNA binding protein
MEDEWLKVKQIATELNVHNMTVYRLIQAGTLRHAKFGRSYRVRRSALNEYIRSASSKDAFDE